jgi:hypothetical protein
MCGLSAFSHSLVSSQHSMQQANAKNVMNKGLNNEVGIWEYVAKKAKKEDSPKKRPKEIMAKKKKKMFSQNKISHFQ